MRDQICNRAGRYRGRARLPVFEEYAAWLIVAVTALFLAGYLIINAPMGRKAVHAMLDAKGRFFCPIAPKADLPLPAKR